MITELRGRYVEVPCTLKQRVSFYFRRLWRALSSPVPKTYTKEEIVKPGEDGYEECMLEIHTNMLSGSYKDNHSHERP